MKRLRQRLLICLVCAVVASSGCRSDDRDRSEQSEPAERPNVLLIVIDTLRADYLRQYGYHLDSSPGLDPLIGQSTLYTRAFSPSSWTRESMASLFTGLEPLRHGATGGHKLRASQRTLAELLRDQGWQTVGLSDNPYVSSETELNRGFTTFFEDLKREATTYRHISETLADAEKWLVERPAGPFFMFIQPMNVHGPYRVPPEQRSVLLGREPSWLFRYYGRPMKSILEGDIDKRKLVTEEILESLDEKYGTAVRYTTDQLGLFFRSLREKGLWDNTLVIVTSDHGEEMFEHGGFSHGYSLYQELLHVPMIIKRPGQRHPAVDASRVSLLDLLPTIAETVGVHVPPDMDGTPIFDPQRSGSRGVVELTAEFYQVRFDKRCSARAVVDWPWKLIHTETNYEGARNAVELYNLDSDPTEKRDVSEEHPGRVKRMLAALHTHFADEVALPEEKDEFSEEHLEHLRALGYQD